MMALLLRADVTLGRGIRTAVGSASGKSMVGARTPSTGPVVRAAVGGVIGKAAVLAKTISQGSVVRAAVGRSAGTAVLTGRSRKGHRPWKIG